MIHTGLARLAKRSAITLVMAADLLFAGCGTGGDPVQLVGQANELRDAGKPQEAVVTVKRALQASPDLVEARELLARLLLELGDGDGASAEFRKLLAAKHHPDQTRQQLLEALLIAGRWEEALDEVEQLKPGAAKEVLRGRALMGLNRLKDAEEAFQSALDLAADDGRALLGLAGVALARGDVDRAARLTEQARLAAASPVESDLIAARIALRRGDGSAAEAAISRVLERRPDNRLALDAMVRAFLLQQRPTDAAKYAAELARRLPPDSPLIAYYRGVIALQEGRLEPARELLRQASTVPMSGIALGAAHLQLGELEQAREVLTAFVGAHPKHLYARKLLAISLLRLGDPEAAAEVLHDAMRAGVGDAGSVALLGQSMFSAGQSESGLRALELAAQLRPDSLVAATELARAQMAIGHPDDAEKTLLAALEKYPDDKFATSLLVEAQMAAGRTMEALGTAEQFATRNPMEPVAHYLLGKALERNGHLVRARTAYEQALVVQPEFPPAILRLAALDRAAGDDNAARRRLELLARRRDLHAVPALLQLAAIAQKAGDTDAARKRYEEILKVEPRNVAALAGLADLAAKAGDPKRGATLLEQARQRNPGALEPRLMLGELYLAWSNLARALEVASEAARIAPADPRSLLLVGRVRLARDEPEKATPHFERAAELAPDEPGPWTWLAQAQLAQGKLAKAEESVRRALDRRPRFLPAMVLSSRLSLARNDYAAAKATAQRILKAYPEVVEGYRLLGDALFAERRFDDAAKSYDAVLARGPSTDVIVRAFQSRWAAGKRREAYALVDDWLEAHPDDLTAVVLKASALTDEKRYAEAAVMYERFVKEHPREPVALNNLAELYGRTGNPEALDLARKAHELAPQLAHINDTYGWLLLEAGKREQALQLLRKAAEADTADSGIQYHYARALAETGDRAGARKVLEEVLAKDTPFAEREDAERLLASLR